MFCNVGREFYCKRKNYLLPTDKASCTSIRIKLHYMVTLMIADSTVTRWDFAGIIWYHSATTGNH